MFNVLSFDPKKISVALSADGDVVVSKKTVEKEYLNMLLAQQHLLKHGPCVGTPEHKKIRILTAEIVGWDYHNQSLSTRFCNGKNLEILLRGSIGTDRNALIGLIRELFRKFKSDGFLWGDFCPRNIIWAQEEEVIWLVDFERELRLRDCPIDERLFSRYVREYSREEFSSFLTRNERELLFEGLLEGDGCEIVLTDRITSKRKHSLLTKMYGEKKYYSLREVHSVEDLMCMVAAPFLVNDAYFFPMDSLDLIGSKGGPNEYVRTVIAIHRLEEYQRFSELKRRTENL